MSKWPRPNHVSELCSFLGFANYYRRFVEGFAKLAAPLHRLVAELTGTKSRKPAIQVLSAAWTDECEKSFEGLKQRLVSAPVLAYANFSLPFILEVDASYQGLDAVLSQEQAGKIRPIAYASCGLRPTERNMESYSSMNLEFLALKWAMTEKFRDYLLGQKYIQIIIPSVICPQPSWALQNSAGLHSLLPLISPSSIDLVEVIRMQMLSHGKIPLKLLQLMN